jgi:hypothetical protein
LDLDFGADSKLVVAGQPQLRIASRGDVAGELRRFDLVVGYSGLGLANREDLSYVGAWETFRCGEDRIRRTPLGLMLPRRSLPESSQH